MASNSVNVAKDGSYQVIPGQYYNPVTDRFEPQTGSQGAANVRSSAESAVVVVPNDANDLPSGPTKGLYIGGTGDLVVVMKDGSEITYKSISSGMIHPLSVKRVKATGTTATDIVAVY